MLLSPYLTALDEEAGEESGGWAESGQEGEDVGGEVGFAAVEEVVRAVEHHEGFGLGHGLHELAEPGGRADLVRAAGQEQFGEGVGKLKRRTASPAWARAGATRATTLLCMVPP